MKEKFGKIEKIEDVSDATDSSGLFKRAKLRVIGEKAKGSVRKVAFLSSQSLEDSRSLFAMDFTLYIHLERSSSHTCAVRAAWLHGCLRLHADRYNKRFTEKTFCWDTTHILGSILCCHIDRLKIDR